MATPTDESDTALRTVPLTPRYAIIEQHGNADAKIRLIDYFRASGINAIVESGDTNIPENSDVFIAISSYLALVSPGCVLWCATADFPNAYKRVPILDDRKEFATIISAGRDGKAKASTLRALPIGSRRVPKDWPNGALFLKCVAATLFGALIAVYVDDVCLLLSRGGRFHLLLEILIAFAKFLVSNWRFQRSQHRPKRRY